MLVLCGVGFVSGSLCIRCDRLLLILLCLMIDFPFIVIFFLHLYNRTIYVCSVEMQALHPPVRCMKYSVAYPLGEIEIFIAHIKLIAVFFANI